MNSEADRNIQGLTTGDDSGEGRSFDNELQLSPEDSDLLREINEFFKARSDIEDVKSDPSYKSTVKLIKPLISEFLGQKNPNDDIKNFIKEGLTARKADDRLTEEISQVKQEIKNGKIDGITVEWVKEWHSRKQKGPDDKQKEIREFVKSSLEPAVNPERISAVHEITNKTRSGVQFTMIASAAAAVMAVIFLIRIIIPPGDPEKIFDKYYEPFNPPSLVTRSPAANVNEVLGSAIEKYKSGNYQLAAVDFSNALLTGPDKDISRFYLGISFIELQHYDRASKLLEQVLQNRGEYSKDAAWYLGLISLKTDNKPVAFEYFKFLAQNTGFYQERAEKILRFLK